MIGAPDPLEGRGLFGQDVTAYDAGRPPYPERVWEVLANRCGLHSGADVLEIGPGTGMVTRRMLSIGANVTAVEPNESMAEFLQKSIGDRITIVVSPFEDAPLEENAFDLAVAATSFHWVDPQRGPARLRRIVRAGGWIAIWWMVFEDSTRPDAFAEAAKPVLGATEPWRPFQLDEAARRADLTNAGFVDVHCEVVMTELEMDAAQIRALYSTMAIVLRREPEERPQVLDALEELVQRKFGGRVQRAFPTALYTARNP